MEMTCNMMLLEQPTVPFSGESRYKTHLCVSGNVEPRQELRRSYPSQSITAGWADPLYHQEIPNKIRAALKLLPLREEHVVVQFWSPRVVGEHLLLTTMDQPFGLGIASEELCYFRRDSEHKAYIVDKDHEEDDLSPPARVFRRGLPEWTPDIYNYKTEDFPQQDCAIRCNLHGYLALPVFDSTTGLCVGVLEILTFSKLEDFTHEVEHIHGALKKENLTSPQAFDGPTLNVSNERSKNESDKIFGILKHVCDTHVLPLAHTWIVSPSTSYCAHEKGLQKSCSSFNTRCLGKVCMSTALPYYVGDVNMWSFIKASKKSHLEMSRGVAGRAMSSHGSCFCEDVTQLDEVEYPLVHDARISKLTSCFAIFLHSVEDNNDYVLEFFLHINDNIHVLNLFNTLKQSIEADFGFELGDVSTMEVIGPPMHLSLNETGSSDSDSVVTDAFETDYADVSMETVCDNFASMVMVNITFNNSKEQFAFPVFSQVSELEKEVSKMFKLDGQEFKLEYVDEDGDLIRVCANDDLESAWVASGGNNNMNLICSKIT